MEYNIYCDESCHLENDSHKVMVLGAVWFASQERREIFDRIREIKIKHGFKPDFEIKWHKVSETKHSFYCEIINFFFDTDKLHFRALVVADKDELGYEKCREPDLRRMERIAWPRPVIDDSEHPYLKVWRNIRRGQGGKKERILILHTEERYLVVLDDRKNYILPWTAY